MEIFLYVVMAAIAAVVLFGLLVLVLKARLSEASRLADELEKRRAVAVAFGLDTTEVDRLLREFGRTPR